MFASRLAPVLRRAASSTTRRPSPQFLVAARQGASGRTLRLSRHFSQVTFTFVDGEGEQTTVTAEEGEKLLDVAQENDLELEGACGGELACSTCHLVFEKRIFDNLPEVSEEEEDMLDLAWGLTDTSRLGCQIHVTKEMEGMTVRIPDEADNLIF
ncbi:2Fe-2S iron-sulfur cluster binding domain [Phytophthora infestans]|uniref:2Fe-2S iron-sulfur cluster binding domain n=1 Tax=Phytophthora infestans TaxID=4787 RepID=A0A833WKG2_PHYIN|nr:2Fe-2S iron-sulfur cluster binding domain [Phytophthora infestans]KAF4147683.1 2Fe-2S iron-sulfur cluster binding domain [Phytophthora infestans]